MWEVSGAGAAESDDETELSLELSIGGSYGKCEKQRAENERVAVNGAAEQVEGKSSGAADRCRRREIQAMRRLEAKRRREEKMRRLEEQQLEERARCRKMREDEEFLEDKSGRRKVSAAKVTNYVNYGNEQKQSGPLKNGYLQTYAAAPASFRPYVHNGGVDDNAARNSGNHGRNNVDLKVVGGNGSLERSSSAISDYRSTSGKGGSTSDTGSHSSCIRIAPNKDTSNQPEARPTTDVPKDMIVLKESHCSADSTPASSKPDPRADVSTSKPENPVSSPLKQQSAEEPPKVGGMPPTLTQMPCVTATGNGPNGKTVTGFLYRYTNAADVRIICVCHGTYFSPAQFVEHAGGTGISHPLRQITIIPSSLG